jgi:hypothetical protein
LNTTIGATLLPSTTTANLPAGSVDANGDDASAVLSSFAVVDWQPSTVVRAITAANAVDHPRRFDPASVEFFSLIGHFLLLL